MIKLSKLTDYAVVILAEMAKEQGELLSASRLALRTSIPEPTVSKVLKMLTREQVIRSVRGISGGYCLDRAAQDLEIKKVITAMEGPIALTSCVEGSTESCQLEDVCSVNGRWAPVNEALNEALSGVNLADMMAPSMVCKEKESA